MPLNDRMVVELIMRQEQEIEERYEGYRTDLLNLVAEVMEMERLHGVQHTNIKQQIGDRCSAVGSLLAQHRSDQESASGGD